jgi:hypothetical protein
VHGFCGWREDSEFAGGAVSESASQRVSKSTKNGSRAMFRGILGLLAEMIKGSGCARLVQNLTDFDRFSAKNDIFAQFFTYFS